MGLSDVLVREIQHHYEVPLVNVPAVQLWARSYPSLLHPKAHKALVHLVHQLLRFIGYALGHGQHSCRHLLQRQPTRRPASPPYGGMAHQCQRRLTAGVDGKTCRLSQRRQEAAATDSDGM
jgi:hypothetical protein